MSIAIAVEDNLQESLRQVFHFKVIAAEELLLCYIAALGRLAPISCKEVITLVRGQNRGKYIFFVLKRKF